MGVLNDMSAIPIKIFTSMYPIMMIRKTYTRWELSHLWGAVGDHENRPTENAKILSKIDENRPGSLASGQRHDGGPS